MNSDNLENKVEDIVNLIDKLNLSEISNLVSKIKEKYNISNLQETMVNKDSEKPQEKTSSSYSFFSLIISSLPNSSLPQFYILVAKLWNSFSSESRTIFDIRKLCNDVVASGSDGVLISKIPSDKIDNFKKELGGFTDKGLVFNFRGDES